MAGVVTCPKPEELQAFVLGRGSAEYVERVAVHLEQCSQCSETVEQLLSADAVAGLAVAADRSWRSSAQEMLAAGATPAVRGLIEKLSALAGSTSRTFDQTDDATPAPQDESVTELDFLAPPESADELGRLASYRVLRVLGQGGMGIVLLAEDLQLRRPAALKVMRPHLAANRLARQRFLREARSAAAVRHDRIVTIYQVGEDRGVPFLAMEHLDGMSLETRLRTGPAPTTSEVLCIGRQIADGLAAAHERGLIHRDIKPSNIWLESSPNAERGIGKREHAERFRVKILDFGLARAVAESAPIDAGPVTQSGVIVGTPAYMAPEQTTGADPDPRSDLFSLGCVLYRSTTGQPPFQGPTMLDVLLAVRQHQPTPPRELNSQMPAALSGLITELLAKDPAERPASARAVAERLETIAQVESTTLVTPAPIPQPATPNDAPSAAAILPKRGTSLARRCLVAAAVLFGTLFCGGFVYRIATDEGEIVIRAHEAGPQVAIKRNGKPVESFEIAHGEKTTTVRSGEIEIAIIGANADEFLVKSDQTGAPHFTLSRSGKVIVEIERKPSVASKEPTPPAVASDPDRRAAEWVLSIGGRVGVSLGTEFIYVTATTDLPEAPFHVGTVELVGNKRVTDANLRHLEGLTHLEALYLNDTMISDAGIEHLRSLTTLKALFLSRTRVSGDALRYLSGLTDLERLELMETRVSDVGLKHLRSLTNLRQLHFWQAPITDAGIEHLAGLGKLEYLNLEGTRVTDDGLRNLTGLTRLTWLFLSGHRITDAGLPHLTHLSNLVELSLLSTKVTDHGMKHLVGLNKLERLAVLYSPGVGDIGLEHLTGLTNISELHLGGTSVGDAGLARLRKLSRLTTLTLGRTKISDAGLAYLKDMTHLKLLDIRETRVTDVGLETLDGLAKLESLGLHATRASNAGMKHLEGLHNLKWLFLGRTNVSDIGLEHIRKLTALAHIELNETRVTDAGLHCLSELPNLERIELNQNRITDAGIKHLASLPKLIDLQILDTRMSARGIATLKTTYPNAAINWSEPNRSAAEAVLALGGIVHTRRKGDEQDRQVTNANELPLEYFQNSRIRLAGVKAPLDELIPKVVKLSDPQFDRLEALDLSDSAANNADVAPLTALPALTELSLARTQVNAVGVSALSRLGNLRSLALDGCPVHDCPGSNKSIGEIIEAFVGLTHLSLANTRCSDPDLGRLKALKNLRRLVLDGCPIRGSGLANLKDLPNLVELRLGCPTFTDVFAPRLSELKQLQRLSLAGSSISDEGLKALAGLANLRELDLSNTKVTAAGFAGLKKVLPNCNVLWGTSSDPERRAAGWALSIGAKSVWIELEGGKVVDVRRTADLPTAPFFVVRIDLWGRTNTHDEALRNVAGLQRLNSFGNAGGGITDAGLDHFRELKTLQVLDIPRTQISDAGLVHIKDLPDLKFLHIAGTRVTDGGMALLPAIATLETLNVEDTAISDAGIAHFLRMTSLRSLAIGGTKITQVGLVRLPALGQLEELLLRELPVTDEVLARLSGIASLKNLQLQKTLITDAGLIQLAKLPGLKHLSLEGTALTDAGLEPLTRLKKLAFLDLRGTNVTQEGIKTLRAAVPTCKLRSDYGTTLPVPESSPAGAPQAPRDLALDWSNPVVRLLKTSTNAHINSVVFTPDSRYLVSGDHASNVRIWEVATGKELRSFIQEGDGHITCLDVSPDGRAIAVGKYKPVLQLRDWETGAVWQTLSGHTDAVIAARFSPDGKHVLTGSEDGTARSWEAASGMQMQIYQGHAGALKSAVFTGDGQKVITASDFDRSIRVWDRATGKELKTITGLESVSSLATSRGSNLVLSAGGQTVAAFDPTTGEELRRWRTPVAVLGLSPDGRVALSAAVFRTHRLWEVATGKLLWSLDGHAVNTWSQNAAFSPDGRHFASGDTEGVILLGRFNPIGASHETTAPSDIDRRTAEWVLQAGGSLRVLVDGAERDVTAAADLPQTAFHVTSIRFEWGNRQVTDDHLKDLRSLRKLQGIVLGGCNITDAGVAHLAEIASLRGLALDATQLTDTGLAQLARLTNLTSLTINGTRITDQGVEHLRALNQLKLLWISHTAVGDRGFQQLGSLAKLQTLQAFETRLTDAGLVHLTGLKDLKQLTIGKTRVTAAGVKKLSSALPECKIESDHAVP